VTADPEVGAAQRLLPGITFPESLPVSARREEIARALHSDQVIVVAGETGSGKTTQIPKICLAEGFGQNGLIGHTQPRRLAARSVAARIAEELGGPLGGIVGYQVRFQDHSSAATRVKLMTDGILLNEIQRDRQLRKYEVLIIDEAHERSLNIDFLLGYLRGLLRRRPTLKLIITSATIDVEKFSAHFDNAPIITVSGRSFPVDMVYQPTLDESGQSLSGGFSDDPVADGVLRALQDITQRDRKRGRAGDVLVFLSGEREIRDLALLLRRHPLPDTEVLPLYARLSANEQQRIFQPHRGRRVVLSTNVAETSLTVPGIEYVIDTGLARISRYSIQSKVQRLPIEPISRASANQRAGRCGRIAPGVCYRLYSEADFLQRPEFTDPEIQRTNLSAVILQMLMLRLGDIERFPFVEPPQRRAVNDGFRLLAELDAIDDERRITATGRQMARLPADPRLTRMLLEAAHRGCLYEMLIIVSALSIQDPRETPADKRDAAREQHRLFSDERSDFLSFVQLWQYYEEQRQMLGSSQLRKYCQQHFLNFLRMREWRETHRQLMLACQGMGLQTRPSLDENGELLDQYEAVHRSIIRGSLNQIGQLTEERDYLGSRNRRFSLYPSSMLARRRPRWIVTAELIETSRLFATLAARIEPLWVEEAAAELVRRDYLEPHWSVKRGEAMAWEKVTLFGLTLIERRRISYSRIDPTLSRGLFIREGLLGGALKSRASFLRDNARLIERVREDEHKLRRGDILVGEEEICAFYHNRIPEAICQAKTFERWCRRERVDQQRLLHLSRSDLIRREVEADTERSFPDHAQVAHNQLKIHYRFEPGSDEDGSRIDVPLPLLGKMRDTDLDWAIPGQLNERCEALVRGLPKSLRKQLMPINDFVHQALQDVTPGQLTLKLLLSEQARRIKGVHIEPAEWHAVTLPLHLRTRLRVVDEQGKILGKGDDLKQLQRQFAPQLAGKESALRAATQHPLECEGLRDWEIDSLPSQITIERGITLLRYPALQDDGDSVSVHLFESARSAALSHRRGLARLLMLRSVQQRQWLERALKQLRRDLGLKFSGHLQDFEANALYAIYRQHFALDDCAVRDADSFQQLLTRGRADLLDEGERLLTLFRDVLEQAFVLRQQLPALAKRIGATSHADIRQQLQQLLPADFPAQVPAGWLREYPRYFKALRTRIEKLPHNAERDEAGTALVAALAQEAAALHQRSELARSRLDTFDFLLQELRISLFAQPLKTRLPVSEKRLRRTLEEAGQQAL